MLGRNQVVGVGDLNPSEQIAVELKIDVFGDPARRMTFPHHVLDDLVPTVQAIPKLCVFFCIDHFTPRWRWVVYCCLVNTSNITKILVTAGPASTMNSAGKIQRIVGKTILTAAFCAISSAR
jgi:hypothetical protein